MAVAVSMTAISSLAAMIMTPFNFLRYGWLNPNTRSILIDIELGSMNILILVPLVMGMLVGKTFPAFAEKAEKPMRYVTLMVLLLFVGGGVR